MKVLLTLLAFPLVGLLAAPAARAAEEKPSAPVRGGRHEVKVVKDVAYSDAKDTDRHKLDLYLPADARGFPVLFYVHGGAWRAGDKRGTGRLATAFARNGIGVATINYRLSPKVKHPAHVQDVARAFAWTRKNIARYGGKPDELFVSGHSAGGHLVALLATDEGYLKAEGLKLADVKGAIPLSGPFLIRPMKQLEAAFGTDEEACKKASPLHCVKGGHPPFLIAFADRDIRTFDRQADLLAKALEGCKCAVTVLKVEDRDHGSIIGRAAANEDDPLFQAMLKFIGKHSGMKLTAAK